MTSFPQQLIQALAAHVDVSRAPAMRAYMRDQFPFLGIKTPERRAACKALLKPQQNRKDLLANAQALWALPEREYQYVAVDLLARHSKNLLVDDLPALLELASEKSWWDTVDGLAGVVGDVVRRACQQRSNQGSALAYMEQALHHADFWRRRIAMLHQLGWQLDTDATRLFTFARCLAHEEEFFIRKAIGWALRDYAWHAPEAVREFLQATPELSSLTRREASKHLS